jgi:hypothetical protein
MRVVRAVTILSLTVIVVAGCEWFNPPTKDECEASFNRFLDACAEKMVGDPAASKNAWAATVMHAAGKAGVKLYIGLQQKDPYLGLCMGRPRLASPFVGKIDLRNTTVGQFCNVKALTPPVP